MSCNRKKMTYVGEADAKDAEAGEVERGIIRQEHS